MRGRTCLDIEIIYKDCIRQLSKFYWLTTIVYKDKKCFILGSLASYLSENLREIILVFSHVFFVF